METPSAQVYASKILKSNSGAILLKTAIISAVFLALSTTVYSYFSNSLNQANKRLYQKRAESLHTKITSTIMHNVAWKRTQEHPTNSAMNCLQSNNCPMTWRTLNLYDAAGALVVSAAGTGFNLEGNPCTGFSAITPSENCPFEYQVSWRPDCTGCQQGVEIRPRFRLSPVRKVVINTAVYGVPYFRDKIEGTLRGQCSSMGGKIDPDNISRCDLPISSSTECPPGYHLDGVDANGSRVCKNLPAIYQSCPNGISNINAQGNIVCR